MASIDKRPNGKYRARWREYPGGPQRTRQFARKVDAQRHLVDVQHRLLTGAYIDPTASRVTFGAYAQTTTCAGSPGGPPRPTWRPSR